MDLSKIISMEKINSVSVHKNQKIRYDSEVLQSFSLDQLFHIVKWIWENLHTDAI
jgi:hypothetical protein